ncbi:MAG: PAS domain-containing protein [Promethearchaeota archaeon]
MKVNLEELLKQASDPVLIIDQNGNLLEANENFRRLLSENQLKKIKNLNIKRLFRLNNNNNFTDSEFIQFYNELKKENHYLHFKIKTSKKNYLYVEGYGIPLKNEDGQGKKNFLVILRPIMEKKRL